MGKQGFSRSCRLTERPQFVRLFENPDTYKTQTFQAFWKSNERATPRLGITIKGRLSSIWRTRLKRVVREWFRVSKAALGKNDVNIVLRVPGRLDDAFVQALSRSLRRWKS